MPLQDYIDMHYHGCRAAFARAQGVTPQAVNRWLNSDFIVVRDVLYSPRRELVPLSSRAKGK